jgi:hypothetical protein
MWLQSIGRWITLPGRICVTIIGHNSPILQSELAKELYTKSLTISVWFAMFLVFGIAQPKATATILTASTTTIVNAFYNKQVSSVIGDAIIFTLFCLLLVPSGAILYSVIMAALAKGFNWLIDTTLSKEARARSIENPQSYDEFLADTLYRMGVAYHHARTITVIFLINFGLCAGLVWLFSPPMINKSGSSGTTDLKTTIFCFLISISSLAIIFAPLIISGIRWQQWRKQCFKRWLRNSNVTRRP